MAEPIRAAAGAAPAVPDPNELLISAHETARRMGIGIRTLQDQTRKGLLPCVRIGRRVLYRPEAVRAALAKLEGGR